MNTFTLQPAQLVVGVLSTLHLIAVCGCAEPQAENPPQESIATAAFRVPEDSLPGTTAELQPWKYIVLHHSATETGSVESIHKAHSQLRDSVGNPWRGIGYHFVIGNGNGMKNGEVQSTFRWQEQTSGAHAGNRIYNDYGIGICLIGNFEENGPTSAQIKALTELVAKLKFQFGITEKQILKHGDLKATACPGRLFPFQQIAKTPSASTPLATSIARSRFSSGEAEHMEGIKNVVSIQRSRSAERTKATGSSEESASQ